MSLIVRGLVAIAAATTLSFPTTPPQNVEVQRSAGRGRPVTRPAVPETPSVEFYATNQLEHYLTDDGIAYVRPGFHIKVNSWDLPADGRMVVDVSFVDDFNQPLDRLGEATPGPISVTFLFGRYDTEGREFINYNTRSSRGSVFPDRDRTGTWTDLEMGHAIYRAGTVLSDDFAEMTHRVGIYGNRDLRDNLYIAKRYIDNVTFDFRPDGEAVTDTWDKINLDTSCNNCHDPLVIHGQRTEPGLCVLCHNGGMPNPDADMKRMIHKIHMSANLPSVVDGGTFEIAGDDFSGIHYPQDIRNCANCHSGTEEDEAPSQQDAWYSYPSSLACGSCHDDVDFVTGENHPAGARDDSSCAECHIPDSGTEFDASVVGAHLIPAKSKQLTGVNVEIVSVSDMEPGKKPTVVFKVTQNDKTPIGPTTFTRSFHPILAGPTSSYKYYYREDARTKAVFDSATGLTTYTFTNMVPLDASGTWAISGDFRRDATVKDGQDMDMTVTEAAINPIGYYALDGGTATPRREVVDIDNCNECHDRLAFHGSQRFVTEECVMCHNPFNDDSARRPAAEGLPESISFQRLIHRIHTGHDLTQPYTVYGYGGTAHEFAEQVHFPGDRRNCEKCHVDESHFVPIPPGVDPVITLRDYFSPQGPGTAACLGCHDFQDAAAHAYLNTAQFPGSDRPSESCGVCHGERADWAVNKVHAR